MSADHKRPLLAFVIVALLCTLIIADSIRSQAVVGYLRAGAARVVQGVELAPLPTGHHFVRTPVAATPVPTEPPSAPVLVPVPQYLTGGASPSAPSGATPAHPAGHAATPGADHASAASSGHQPQGGSPGQSAAHPPHGHSSLGHSSLGQQAGGGIPPQTTPTGDQHATHESSHLAGSLVGELMGESGILDGPWSPGHHGPVPSPAPGTGPSAPSGPAAQWHTWTGQVHQAPGHGHQGHQGHRGGRDDHGQKGHGQKGHGPGHGQHGHGQHGHGPHGHGQHGHGRH